MLLVSFNAHTCVGYQECFIPSATMAIVPGEIAAHKRLNSGPQRASVADGGGDGGDGGGVAGVFLVS